MGRLLPEGPASLEEETPAGENRRVTGRGMSLSRSHCGGCSATFDTPSRTNWRLQTNLNPHISHPPEGRLLPEGPSSLEDGLTGLSNAPTSPNLHHLLLKLRPCPRALRWALLCPGAAPFTGKILPQTGRLPLQKFLVAHCNSTTGSSSQPLLKGPLVSQSCRSTHERSSLFKTFCTTHKALRREYNQSSRFLLIPPPVTSDARPAIHHKGLPGAPPPLLKHPKRLTLLLLCSFGVLPQSRTCYFFLVFTTISI
ncbi:hypothetical protein TNIN_426291 [Trichonephila inaurata madagascariensis]|uniref:Uncharacterized protein n=1 Tax=Trichonephila inaurata madagascariensis TaxID=2747483 RepID=A0A8X6XW40_9ARAC|nr:hypothetical protein TNIN_426291 [Trichonephila inaurata madagascariensis]